MDGVGRSKTRLETWKEVAAFFGKTERTVKRWEGQRGLPVHRLPGESRSRVYADVSELEAWLSSAGAASDTVDPPESPSPSPNASPSLARLLTLAVLAVLTLAIVAWLGWQVGLNWRPDTTGRTVFASGATQARKPGRPPLEAQRLYLAGMDDWAERTPDSLNRAVDAFNGAIRIDPDYAEAYVGLASTYNLLREYTLMPASQAYPLAKAAAQHALALDDSLAQAHAALAFVDYFGFWDSAAARREYRRAIALDDRSATAHHWYATFMLEQTELAGAQREIDRALELDPGSESIQSDRGLILYFAGRRAEGLEALIRVEAANPKFLSPHNYLALIHFAQDQDRDFIRQSAIAARLTNDRSRLALMDAATAGLAAGGHRGMLQGLLDEQVRQFKDGVGTAYAVAVTSVHLGQFAQALAYLQVAVTRREQQVTAIRGDPNLQPLRSYPEFGRIVAQIRPS